MLKLVKKTAAQACIKLNADLRMPASAQTDEQDWVLTPQIGVQRKLLERDGGEFVSRATSVVRYAPGSEFSPHTHDGGEEFIVLRGTFSDDSGDYPKGWYVRNPPGSSHAPYSENGCEILVKLGQIPRMDRKTVRMDTSCANANWEVADCGTKTLTLHDSPYEHVALMHWPKGLKTDPTIFTGGAELFLISGRFVDEYGDHHQGSWLRIPPGHGHKVRAIEDSLVYVKTGHLRASTISQTLGQDGRA